MGTLKPLVPAKAGTQVGFPLAPGRTEGVAPTMQTGLRQLYKGARAMREAAPARRQPVFFLGRHFPEGAVVPVRQEHRIVAETLRAARRPDQRAADAAFEFLHMTVRPSETKRRDEMGA